ncbi:MAG TPA: formyltetrahydrofolate deformylase [Bdellovibrionota bacterium]|nr:formyltetrahydrofolate deformylase [Bdellovibrionota bacterium]
MTQPRTAVLLITCPDTKGIVATLADFLYRNGANILHSDQHEDSENTVFLMRIEWDLDGFGLQTREQFTKAFQPIAERFKMEWRFESSDRKPRVALLASKYDHCLSDILYRHQSGELRCEIPLIIANHPDTDRWAKFYGVPFHHIPVTPATKAGAEERIETLLRKDSIDLVVLARYMQVLSPEFVSRYRHRIINIHHSFLPAFLGAKPYHRAFERGVKLIGATSHYVTDDLDEGPIIEQDVIRISHRDSVEDLIQKGRDLEKIILSRAIRWHLDNRVLVYANKTVVFD